MYRRKIAAEVIKRIKGRRIFIQVLAGPRQTGKTTIARQVIKAAGLSARYASADEPVLKNTVWIEEQWQAARIKAGKIGKKTLLVLDEIQKIPNWSERVKQLWDEDSAHGLALQVIILGSSPLLLQRGLGESLAGRFEI
ncbi:MAG: AAA family ATPase, partial [Elusimicrobia bacterium]|nr:AAA family ATPase [Elusimicrobiota bacterium]